MPLSLKAQTRLPWQLIKAAGTDDPTFETLDPSDEPVDDQTVQTGDTQMLKPYVLAGSIALVIGCLVLVDQKRFKLFKR